MAVENRRRPGGRCRDRTDARRLSPRLNQSGMWAGARQRCACADGGAVGGAAPAGLKSLGRKSARALRHTPHMWAPSTSWSLMDDAGLLQRLDERAILLQQEVVLADAQPQQARALVEGRRVGGQPRQLGVHPLGPAEGADPGELVRVASPTPRAWALPIDSPATARLRPVRPLGRLDQRHDVLSRSSSKASAPPGSVLLTLRRPLGRGRRA